MEMLNYRVRLTPSWNSITEEIDYKITKFFDIEQIMDFMLDIDVASMQIDLKFDMIYGFLENL